MAITKLLEKLLNKEDLSFEEISKGFEQLMKDPDPVDIAAFLLLLKSKGETGEEMAGIASAIQKSMDYVEVDRPLLDIVGTGGDGLSTVNISTGAAIVAASCGAVVAKHGNRSVSSRCGSADLVEALGINLEEDHDRIKRELDEVGIAFLYAPRFSPAMKVFLPIRKRLGLRTVLNLLGPLLNPAKAEYRMVGVWDASLIDKMAKALQQMSIKKAYIFHGEGLDEISTVGMTEGLYLDEYGKLSRLIIDPSEFGFKKAIIQDLQGGDVEENKSLLIEAIKGKEGAIQDTLALNAGVGLWIYGIAPTIEEGIKSSLNAIKTGKAEKKLKEWIHFEKAIIE
ncbi:MAG: anthranilate phosphoribosyltransferase [Parachlamydiaceae bacterium]